MLSSAKPRAKVNHVVAAVAMAVDEAVDVAASAVGVVTGAAEAKVAVVSAVGAATAVAVVGAAAATVAAAVDGAATVGAAARAAARVEARAEARVADSTQPRPRTISRPWLEAERFVRNIGTTDWLLAGGVVADIDYVVVGGRFRSICSHGWIVTEAGGAAMR